MNLFVIDSLAAISYDATACLRARALSISLKIRQNGSWLLALGFWENLAQNRTGKSTSTAIREPWRRGPRGCAPQNTRKPTPKWD